MTCRFEPHPFQRLRSARSKSIATSTPDRRGQRDAEPFGLRGEHHANARRSRSSVLVLAGAWHRDRRRVQRLLLIKGPPPDVEDPEPPVRRGQAQEEAEEKEVRAARRRAARAARRVEAAERLAEAAEPVPRAERREQAAPPERAGTPAPQERNGRHRCNGRRRRQRRHAVAARVRVERRGAAARRAPERPARRAKVAPMAAPERQGVPAAQERATRVEKAGARRTAAEPPATAALDSASS